jgi:Fe/S biogenesis protein NfuA
MGTTTDTVIMITEPALSQILQLREQEEIPDLSLGLRIVGVGQNGFLYETAFLRPDDVAEGDHVEHHGDLPVAIPPDSLDNLRGAILDVSDLPDAPGLVLRNPNPPSPSITSTDAPPIELEGTVEERVAQLLAEHINPAIASHGGFAELDHVDGDTAFVVLGGGCQGCGLAAMTLRQGIETAIRHNVPEITEVVDVTDHAAGMNPFYA